MIQLPTPACEARSRIRAAPAVSVITTIQDDAPILILYSSFQAPESGFDHQAEMPQVPPPESLVSELEMARAAKDRIPARIRT